MPKAEKIIAWARHGGIYNVAVYDEGHKVEYLVCNEHVVDSITVTKFLVLVDRSDSGRRIQRARVRTSTLQKATSEDACDPVNLAIVVLAAGRDRERARARLKIRRPSLCGLGQSTTGRWTVGAGKASRLLGNVKPVTCQYHPENGKSNSGSPIDFGSTSSGRFAETKLTPEHPHVSRKARVESIFSPSLCRSRSHGQLARGGVLRSLQHRDIHEILAALGDAAVVAGAVFPADKTVGRAAAQRCDIEVRTRRSDLSCHMAADLLSGFERPRLGLGVRQEAAEGGAMLARAWDVVRARPIPGRLQGFGRPLFDMRKTGSNQVRHGRAGSLCATFQQTLYGRKQSAVDAVGLGPGEQMPGQSPSQFAIKRFGDPYEIGDGAHAGGDAATAPPLINGGARRFAWQ
jgi:hypothetical protein